MFDNDPFFSSSMGSGLGGGLFRARSLFEDDGFFGSNKGSLGFRSSSFGADFNEIDFDSHPQLSKSVSTTTRTV